jgi:succinyl-CoA synthetase alpha subunit
MPTLTHVIANTYRDSVALMQLSAALRALPGVEEAAMIMATEGNLALLREVRLLDGAVVARPSDLLIVVRAKTAAAAAAAVAYGEGQLKAVAPAAATGGGPAAIVPRSIDMALAEAPQSNLALISVPGEYAAAEAAKALARGLNVMLFSDNVSLDDEVALKRRAAEQGLLVMGPDCGTAIIDGVPLAFANRVQRGAIGCVAASGTGLQQVTTLVDRLGLGISQAIGTGGRDLSEAVGGVTMLAGLKALAADRETKVIVLISKPPAQSVATKVIAAAARVRKPVVVNFIGASTEVRGKNLHAARTLEDAARAAVALARGRKPPKAPAAPRIGALPRLTKSQRYVRGLFSGGTFCYEADLVLRDALGESFEAGGHELIDLGDDRYTRGRPHPMIDHRLRNERIGREANDPQVTVILLDVVLGHGAHPDPAAEMAPALRAARKANRHVAIVGSVCGTEADPQGLARQEAALRAAGVILGASNAEAARIAAKIVSRGRG